MGRLLGALWVQDKVCRRLERREMSPASAICLPYDRVN